MERGLPLVDWRMRCKQIRRPLHLGRITTRIKRATNKDRYQRTVKESTFYIMITRFQTTDIKTILRNTITMSP